LEIGDVDRVYLIRTKKTNQIVEKEQS